MQEQIFLALTHSHIWKKWGDILWNSNRVEETSFENVLQLKLQWIHSLTIVLQLWMMVLHLEQLMRKLATEWSIIFSVNNQQRSLHSHLFFSLEQWWLANLYDAGESRLCYTWCWWVEITLHWLVYQNAKLFLNSAYICISYHTATDNSIQTDLVPFTWSQHVYPGLITPLPRSFSHFPLNNLT